MSSITPENNFIPDDLAAQISVLEEIQTINALTMSEPIGDAETSIAEKVRNRLGLGSGKVARLMVSVGSLGDSESDTRAERIYIKARVGTSDEKAKIKHIPAAKVYGDVVKPEEGFTGMEAVVLAGMAQALELDQQVGPLSQLDTSRSYIINPSASIMALHPIAASAGQSREDYAREQDLRSEQAGENNPYFD